MATSGVQTLSYDRNDIIRAALREIQVISYSETPDHDSVAAASDQLNLMLQSWQMGRVGQWLWQECTLFTEVGKISYELGPEGDHCSPSALVTKLPLKRLAGSTILYLDTGSRMVLEGDTVGLVLDDGTVHWSTASSAIPRVSITISDAIPEDASSGNPVYLYTGKTPRPEEVRDVRSCYSNAEVPMHPYSRQEYFELTIRDSRGKPVHYYYEPGVKSGRMYIFPTSDHVQNFIRMSIRRPLFVFTHASDELDFPQVCLEAVIKNLAVRLIPLFQKPMTDARKLMVQQAMQLEQNMRMWDREKTSVVFRPTRRYRR